MDKFLERLDDLRNGTTVEILANHLKMGSSTIFSWYSRKNMPNLNNMIVLSNYFKCSIEYLLGRTDNFDVIPPKECPPFHIRLENILKSKGLKKTYLRNKGVISAGFNDSIFNKHSSPYIDNVIKIADYLNMSVDELVGRV